MIVHEQEVRCGYFSPQVAATPPIPLFTTSQMEGTQILKADVKALSPFVQSTLLKMAVNYPIQGDDWWCRTTECMLSSSSQGAHTEGRCSDPEVLPV